MKLIKRLAFVMIATVALGMLLIAASIPVSRLEPAPGAYLGTPQARILFADVTVLAPDRDGQLTLQPHRWVRVQDGTIILISDQPVESTDDEQVVPGENATLMPGLVDAHVHVFDPADLANYLTRGVTGVRNMMGMDFHRHWRDQVRDGRRDGPRLLTASPTLNQSDSFIPFHRMIGDESEIEPTIRAFVDQGYDFIKVYSGLSESTFAQVLAVAQDLDVPVAGHLPDSVPLENGLAAGLFSLEHAEDLYNLVRDTDAETRQAIVQRIAESQVFFVPTLKAYHNYLLASQQGRSFPSAGQLARINPVIQFFGARATDWAYDHPNPERIEAKLKSMTDLTVDLYDSGARMLLGTDTGPAYTLSGEALHREIALLRQAGVPMERILASGTSIPGVAFGGFFGEGKIRTGASTDLILVEGNPLIDPEVMRAPRVVVTAGTYYGPEELAELDVRGKTLQGAYRTAGALLDHQLSLD